MAPPHAQPTSGPQEKSDNVNLTYVSQRNDNRVPVSLVGAALESDGVGATSNHSALVISSHLHGIRLFLVTILNAVMLFLVQAEIFIVTTSIVAITGELGDFDAASWILASYFLGYGVGGGGSYALATIVTIEVVPPEGYPTQMTYMGIAVMLALILGPIAGGGISSVATWRWIFLLNVPIGVVGLVLAIVGIPAGFPHHQRKKPGNEARGEISQQRARPLNRLDMPGGVLLLLATMSIVAAFQEAGSRFSWGSAYFITLLVVSILLWLVLVIWERRVTLANAVREPVLPWRFLRSRFMVGTLLFQTLILNIPHVAEKRDHGESLPRRINLLKYLELTEVYWQSRGDGSGKSVSRHRQHAHGGSDHGALQRVRVSAVVGAWNLGPESRHRNIQPWRDSRDSRGRLE
ncbi:hypothetical protein PG997_000584 [Apiospora hydei]|uniref:Major facilitator superfamily (MFS) profile domain-containing protein n=1 Tax=Apiospora hydei TaxID=1337664 RepID=A0ABR1XB97_9PEZI